MPLKATGLIVLLLLVALATLLLLPGQIQTPTQGSVDVAEQSSDTAPVEQPFSDAQLLRARQEAQQILADLISAQNELEELMVESWANDANSEILELAASGDVAYRQREFEDALNLYKQAEELASGLLQQRSSYADEALAEGDAAFSRADITMALEKYRLAQTLAPDNEKAQQGIDRSLVLDEVNRLKTLAAESRTADEWNSVANYLEEAVDLDPLDEEAVNLLSEAREEIRQISFRESLAEGFNALAEAEYGQARIAFLRADQLVPGSSTVADALLQVESAAETGQRGELLDQAQVAESQENWELAAQFYRDLLERDESNLEARVNLVRVEARAELNQRIEEILDNPTTLQSDERWDQAEATLAEARAVINKTPGLVAQIADLERVIQQARTPVQLHILSDGMTQIEIYRIGRLGAVTDHQVNIYPGEYVVIGRRSGYRDIRKELEIPGGTTEITLRIEADEPI